MSEPVQQHRAIAVSSPLGDDVLLLRRMRGSEHMAALFEYRLDVYSEEDHLDFDQLLGQNMTVRLELPESEETRYFNGYVAELNQLASEGRYAAYEVILRPWLWFLTHTTDCRIFQHKSTPEIVREIFAEHGLVNFEIELSASYPSHEYCVQYRESDFAFIGRLLEDQGIYYYFLHENGKHTLILADSLRAHDSVDGYETIPFYHDDARNRRERDHIFDWSVSKQVRSGSVALNDFDFKAPRKSLNSSLAVSRAHAQSSYEVYDYPGNYTEFEAGENRSRIRMEEIQADHEVFRGRGNARGLAVGALFSLVNCWRPDHDREYLVLSATYELTSDDYQTGLDVAIGPVYSVACTAIDARQPYRPPRITPVPKIRGPQTAVVVGKTGEEIWTDEYGRVKVQFHWDRYGKADENSSCWVRVAQVWAGKNWGALFLPRIGQEVIVEFLEGDPDRPIVTGRVYNGTHRPPYSLPQHQTVSTLKSLSSKGGEGFNELRFDDKKGEEQIFIHAERNKDIRIKNDCYQWIGQNRHLIVKQDTFEHTQHNLHCVVDNDRFDKVGNDVNLVVAGKQAIKVSGSHSLAVNGNVMEDFKANHSQLVSGDHYLKAGGIVLEATAGITLKCGGSHLTIDPAGVTVKGPLVTVDGALVKIASGPGSPPAAGKPGTAVPPVAAIPAEEADNADPGTMEAIKAEQRQQQRGKYGSAPVKPHKKPTFDGGAAGGGDDEDEEEKKHWIEIELTDEDGEPVPGEKYRIVLPDETVAEGTLDSDGRARVDGIENPGACEVRFPNLEDAAIFDQR